jgi:hypothetical protein
LLGGGRNEREEYSLSLPACDDSSAMTAF